MNTLTFAEFRVIHALSHQLDKSSLQVSRQLGIGIATISWHMQYVYQKQGIHGDSKRIQSIVKHLGVERNPLPTLMKPLKGNYFKLALALTSNLDQAGKYVARDLGIKQRTFEYRMDKLCCALGIDFPNRRYKVIVKTLTYNNPVPFTYLGHTIQYMESCRDSRDFAERTTQLGFTPLYRRSKLLTSETYNTMINDAICKDYEALTGSWL